MIHISTIIERVLHFLISATRKPVNFHYEIVSYYLSNTSVSAVPRSPIIVKSGYHLSYELFE